MIKSLVFSLGLLCTLSANAQQNYYLDRTGDPFEISNRAEEGPFYTSNGVGLKVDLRSLSNTRICSHSQFMNDNRIALSHDEFESLFLQPAHDANGGEYIFCIGAQGLTMGWDIVGGNEGKVTLFPAAGGLVSWLGSGTVGRTIGLLQEAEADLVWEGSDHTKYSLGQNLLAYRKSFGKSSQDQFIINTRLRTEGVVIDNHVDCDRLYERNTGELLEDCSTSNTGIEVASILQLGKLTLDVRPMLDFGDGLTSLEYSVFYRHNNKVSLRSKGEIHFNEDELRDRLGINDKKLDLYFGWNPWAR